MWSSKCLSAPEKFDILFLQEVEVRTGMFGAYVPRFTAINEILMGPLSQSAQHAARPHAGGFPIPANGSTFLRSLSARIIAIIK